MTAKDTTVTIMPAMRYADAPAAIDWLCRTFGCEKYVVYPGEDGLIAHAELDLRQRYDHARERTRRRLRQARDDAGQVGGRTTQSVYVVVSDIDALYSRVKAAGAQMVRGAGDHDVWQPRFLLP